MMKALLIITGAITVFTIVTLVVFLFNAHSQIKDLKRDFAHLKNLTYGYFDRINIQINTLMFHARLDKIVFLSNAEEVKQFINNSEKPLRVTRNEIFDEDNHLIAMFTI